MEIDIDKNRAFRYGDGLFETVIYKNNQLQHWPLHINRLKKGCAIMQFESNFLFENDFLKSQVLSKIKTTEISKAKRIKIIVWRQDGGLYTPISNIINYEISISDLVINDIQILTKVGIAKNIFLNYSVTSMLKTTNAIPYVLAGLEKKNRNLDDILLLDNLGNIAEGSSSNIFWEKNDIIYTPSLTCGCIAGVGREYILLKAKEKNITIIDGQFKVEELKNADCVILTNVVGIKKIATIENHIIPNKLSVLSKILPELI